MEKKLSEIENNINIIKPNKNEDLKLKEQKSVL